MISSFFFNKEAGTRICFPYKSNKKRPWNFVFHCFLNVKRKEWVKKGMACSLSFRSYAVLVLPTSMLVQVGMELSKWGKC